MECAGENVYQCNMGHTTNAPIPRWVMSMKIDDFTGSNFVSVFADAGNKIVGQAENVFLIFFDIINFNNHYKQQELKI